MQTVSKAKIVGGGLPLSGPRLLLPLVVGMLWFTASVRSRADAVTDWNEHLDQAIRTAAVGVGFQPRHMALVQTAVYDAVNGIVRQHEPYFVTERRSHNARADAAAIQAAYTALVALFPAQQATLDAHLADSLSSLPAQRGQRRAIFHGRRWGESVANRILAWRSTDGLSASIPDYFGGTDPGIWRSLPTATAPEGTLPAVTEPGVLGLVFGDLVPEPSGGYGADITVVEVVPEPAGIACLAALGLGVFALHRRRSGNRAPHSRVEGLPRADDARG